jgi:hypothetical protein
MAKRGTTKRITFEQLASARLGYERDGLTFLQLAQRYGVSESGIRGLLKAVGVTARPPGFAAAFGQEGNLNVVADLLTKALDILPPYEAGLALIAAGLDVLPVARCAGHYREALLQVRAEVDRLLAESAN